MILRKKFFLCSICGDAYPCFEISAVNADKPPLSISQIKNRVKQFEEAGEPDCVHHFGCCIFLFVFENCLDLLLC